MPIYSCDFVHDELRCVLRRIRRDMNQLTPMHIGSFCSAECKDGSTVSVDCSGEICSATDWDVDPEGVGYAQCGETREDCEFTTGPSSSSSGGGSCPSGFTISEYIHPCYPSTHPYGRASVSPSGNGVVWSGLHIQILAGGTTEDVIFKPTSIGGYTLTATIDFGNGCVVTKSKNFYAYACN